MIKILKVEFNNYRQYKHVTIDFSQLCQNNLHVLKAKNGTGKTTFLNAVLWCFYSEEKYLNDTSRALPIINESLVQKSKPGTKLEANVRITICDGFSNLVFSRTIGFTVIEDPIRHIKNAVPGATTFTVSITNLNDPNKNTVVYDDESYTSGLVKQYFDSEIFDYYFFDGENLENYFSTDSSKTGKIKNSIYNIAQVTMLETASNHVISMANEKYRKASKEFDGDASLYDELSEIQEDLARLIADNHKYEEENKKYEARIQVINGVLDDVKPVKLKQQERSRLEEQYNRLLDDKKSFIVKRNTFITKYTILLNYYPLMKSTLEMILEKEKSGNLPPDIDKKLLKKILTEHITTCPVCKKTIDQEAILQIEKLIATLDVDSGTSNRLMEIKGHLEDFVLQAQNYDKEKKKLQVEGKYLDDQLKKLKIELDNISAFLSKFGIADDVNVTALEKERTYKTASIKSNERSIGSNETQIKNKKDRIKVLEKLISELEERTKSKNLLMDQVRVLRHLSTEFDKVKSIISTEIKLEIEEITWKFFDSMIWKTNTFDHLKISDDYVISVFNKNGKEITGSMSATELMALAYSFTFAIHEASGKNCPLIVDSPLGRVSDDNRVNMAKELLKVSKDKQIIMLFTPDEYSEEVRNIYDSEAGSVRDIKLSDDENEILKVGA